jgi:hypothetical protein
MWETFVDLAHLFAATGLFAVLLLLPGAALADRFGGLGAKELGPSFQWGLALLFSFAVLPALLSLIARFVSVDAALTALLVLALLGIPAARRIGPPSLAAIGGLVAFSLLVGFELVDFYWGGKLYQASYALDMVKHAATVNSIVSWGLPLVDPFVARAQSAGYYYFSPSCCGKNPCPGGRFRETSYGRSLFFCSAVISTSSPTW